MMSKIIAISTLLVAGSAGLHAERILIDKIVARVNGANILASDLQQPRIAKEGSSFSLEEAITDKLFYQKAASMHMLPSTLDIDRQLVAFKVHNDLTQLSEAEFENQLKQSGFTLAQYKQQLGEMMAVENIKRAEVSEKIVVTTQEVEEFYKKHPEHTTEAYHLQIASIPEAQFSSKEAALADPALTWEDHGLIEKKELDDAYQKVTALNPGEVLDPIKKDGYYDLVKLIAKQEARLKTLKERYSSIERTIQNKRRGKIIVELEKKLRKQATVVYLD